MLDEKTFMMSYKKLEETLATLNNPKLSLRSDCFREFKNEIGPDLMPYIKKRVLFNSLGFDFEAYRIIFRIYKHSFTKEDYDYIFQELIILRKKAIEQNAMTEERQKSFLTLRGFLCVMKTRQTRKNEIEAHFEDVDDEGKSIRKSLSLDSICAKLKFSPTRMPIDFPSGPKYVTKVGYVTYYDANAVYEWINKHYAHYSERGITTLSDMQTFYTTAELTRVVNKPYLRSHGVIFKEDIETISKLILSKGQNLHYIFYNVKTEDGIKPIVLLNYSTLLVLYSAFVFGVIRPKDTLFKDLNIEQSMIEELKKNNFSFPVNK